MVAEGQIEAGGMVKVEPNEEKDGLVLKASKPAEPVKSGKLKVMLVDDNIQLLVFLEHLLTEAGWDLLKAESAAQARKIFAEEKPDTIVVDYMLGDDDGVALGLQLQMQAPKTQVIIMTGGELSVEEEAICAELNIPILRKPFLGNDVLNLVRSRRGRASVSSAAS
jgi:Response regulators consisting of a CheY-like receiver domain and a winged-helix DNA-binding domain